jgi:methyl-accepting chemotaxis protein
MSSAWSAYKSNSEKVRELQLEGRNKEAVKLSLTDGRRLDADLNKLIDDFIAFNKKEVEDLGVEAKNDYEKGWISIITLLAFGVLIGLALSIKTAGDISKSLSVCLDASEHFIRGDFNRQITITAKDDLGILQESMRQMSDRVRAFIGDINTMSKKHELGDIDVDMGVDNHQGDFKTMAQCVNTMVEGHIQREFGCPHGTTARQEGLHQPRDRRRAQPHQSLGGGH